MEGNFSLNASMVFVCDCCGDFLLENEVDDVLCFHLRYLPVVAVYFEDEVCDV